jgi:hypothetical protein
MGLPLSPIIIDMVMEDLLDKVIYELGYDPLICVKYVDDLLFILPLEELENTYNIFNGYNEKIKFTMEMENEKTLPYLDVELIRQRNGRILTKWYFKPMASNRLLNYNSNHSLAQKINVANGLIKRVCDLTTIHPKVNNFKRIKTILEKNNYPVALIRKLFYKHINTQHNKAPSESTDTSVIKYRSLPNVNGLTEKIKKCVRSVDKSIQICPKNTKTIKKLYSKIKDKIDISKQSNLVYSIPCLDCNKQYIGMTHRQFLHKRLGQHFADIECLHKMRKDVKIEKMFDISDEIEIKITEEESKNNNNKEKIKKLQKLVKQCEKSGLVSHHIQLGHRLNFKNTKILDKEQNKKKLEVLEVLHIKTNENMNKQEDTNLIKTTYDGILHKIKKRNNNKILKAS